MFIVLGLTPIETCSVWPYSIWYTLIWVWPCAHNQFLKKNQSVIMYYIRVRLFKTVILPKLLNKSVPILKESKKQTQYFFEGVKHFLSRPSPKPKFINIYDKKRISLALRVYLGLQMLSLLSKETHVSLPVGVGVGGGGLVEGGREVNGRLVWKSIQVPLPSDN